MVTRSLTIVGCAIVLVNIWSPRSSHALDADLGIPSKQKWQTADGKVIEGMCLWCDSTNAIVAENGTLRQVLIPRTLATMQQKATLKEFSDRIAYLRTPIAAKSGKVRSTGIFITGAESLDEYDKNGTGKSQEQWRGRVCVGESRNSFALDGVMVYFSPDGNVCSWLYMLSLKQGGSQRLFQVDFHKNQTVKAFRLFTNGQVAQAIVWHENGDLLANCPPASWDRGKLNGEIDLLDSNGKRTRVRLEDNRPVGDASLLYLSVLTSLRDNQCSDAWEVLTK